MLVSAITSSQSMPDQFNSAAASGAFTKFNYISDPNTFQMSFGPIHAPRVEGEALFDFVQLGARH